MGSNFITSSAQRDIWAAKWLPRVALSSVVAVSCLIIFGIVLVQVVLGAVTVFAGNGAPTVAAHLLAGLTLLTATTITALATRVDRRPTPQRSKR